MWNVQGLLWDDCLRPGQILGAPHIICAVVRTFWKDGTEGKRMLWSFVFQEFGILRTAVFAWWILLNDELTRKHLQSLTSTYHHLLFLYHMTPCSNSSTGRWNWWWQKLLGKCGRFWRPYLQRWRWNKWKETILS